MSDALKKEFIDLVKKWQKEWIELRGGKKVTMEEIASQMDFTRVHLTRMMGPDYKIDEKALKYATNAYKLWQGEMFVNNMKQNVSHETLTDQEMENAQSLERSLEMALSIADRVTVMLEKKYGMFKPKGKINTDKEPAATPEPGGENASRIKKQNQPTK